MKRTRDAIISSNSGMYVPRQWQSETAQKIRKLAAVKSDLHNDIDITNDDPIKRCDQLQTEIDQLESQMLSLHREHCDVLRKLYETLADARAEVQTMLINTDDIQEVDVTHRQSFVFLTEMSIFISDLNKLSQSVLQKQQNGSDAITNNYNEFAKMKSRWLQLTNELQQVTSNLDDIVFNDFVKNKSKQ